MAVLATGDGLMGEWRLDATFARPVLYDDRLLIEPTGEPVQLCGASAATFSGSRIRAFRHYFDDSAMFASVPYTSPHLRWLTND